eukprot:2098130-Pyramimonas_sp.AAC.1
MFTRDPGLVYLRATEQAARFALRLAGRLMPQAPGAGGRCAEETAAFNEELWLPSHGAYSAVGLVTRVMNYLCWANSKGVARFMQNDKELSAEPPVAVR